VRKALVDHEVQRPCPSCIERLARAADLAPERDSLRDLLARWKLEAETEKDFWREGSQHFDLSYEGWRNEIIASSQQILDELERAYLDLSERFRRSTPARAAIRTSRSCCTGRTSSTH
jgi:hypothetical protein